MISMISLFVETCPMERTKRLYKTRRTKNSVDFNGRLLSFGLKLLELITSIRDSCSDDDDALNFIHLSQFQMIVCVKHDNAGSHEDDTRVVLKTV